MSATLTYLPGTGRGTMRSMVEGQVRLHTASDLEPVLNLPLHHLGWSPSPCRGGTAE